MSIPVNLTSDSKSPEQFAQSSLSIVLQSELILRVFPRILTYRPPKLPNPQDFYTHTKRQDVNSRLGYDFRVNENILKGLKNVVLIFALCF